MQTILLKILLLSNAMLFFVLDSNENDKILADGIMHFLEDLGLSPDSRLVLLLAWKFKSSTQCVFTKEEFINGMTELGYSQTVLFVCKL